jgi:antitoxin component HigA of HigAB toxin-antitoxin module
VLTRKRPFTLPMVRALSTLLDIPSEILIQPYALKRAA